MESKNKFYFAIAIVGIVVIFWIWWASSNPVNEQALVTFLSVEELMDDGISDRVRLGGLVEDGSIQLNEDNFMICNFELKEGDYNLPVKYTGVRPDLFKDGAEVIVEGNYKNGVFVADVLQTKCASRYEGDLRDADSNNAKEESI
ncbi:MAG: cytochrome c maturation protein CcmE [Fidelibacterota bacterium]